ncbi:MAG: putative metal-binding motif-containing protein, partial [Myxococcota bacterium]|nr:putative metal-binding motif-containing protein [Myxococcota bacterium]
DDNDPQRHPGKLEVCDDRDNNCLDGLADEPYQDFYRDDDGDAFGRDQESTKACRRPDGYALDDGDCDDEDRDRHPAAGEICDGIDNNCDDTVDEGLELQEMFADVDGDGFGDENAQGIQACLGTPLLAADNSDCDDTNASRFPGAPEWCDGVDQDCDQIADNDITVRSHPPVDLGNFGGTIESLRADNSELRWSDRLGGDPNARIMRRSFDANDAVEFNAAGDITPLSLADFGQASGLLGQSAGRCQLQINGAAWTPFGPADCRPMAVCPLPTNGGQNFWVVILTVSDNGQETAGLYSVDHQGQSSLLNSLVSGSLVTHADCDGDRFVALSVLQNNKENLHAGPAPSPALRQYDNSLRGIDLLVNDQGALLAVTRSDGVVEVESLSAQGASLSRNLLVGAPKQAAAARLIGSPSGAVLAYPVLEPAFERGVWATPVDTDGAPSGAQQRLTNESTTQIPTQTTKINTAGMGNLYYVGATNIRKLFLGCAPP